MHAVSTQISKVVSSIKPNKLKNLSIMIMMIVAFCSLLNARAHFFYAIMLFLADVNGDGTSLCIYEGEHSIYNPYMEWTLFWIVSYIDQLDEFNDISG